MVSPFARKSGGITKLRQMRAIHALSAAILNEARATEKNEWKPQAQRGVWGGGRLACTSIQKSTCTAQWTFPRETSMERTTVMWWVRLTWTSRSSSTFIKFHHKKEATSTATAIATAVWGRGSADETQEQESEPRRTGE